MKVLLATLLLIHECTSSNSSNSSLNVTVPSNNTSNDTTTTAVPSSDTTTTAVPSAPCGVDQAVALGQVAGGDLAALASLTAGCSGCLVANQDSFCLCLDAAMCVPGGCLLAEDGGCTPCNDCSCLDDAACEASEDCSLADGVCQADDSSNNSTDKPPPYVPKSVVTVVATATFSKELSSEEEEAVEETYCEKVQAATQEKLGDVEFSVECSITKNPARRRLLASVSYTLSAEVTVATATLDAQEAEAGADLFDEEFTTAVQTAVAEDENLVTMNGGEAPTVAVAQPEVSAVTTTTPEATTGSPDITTGELAVTTGEHQFSSATLLSSGGVAMFAWLIL